MAARAGDRYGPAVDQARLALEPDDPTLRVSELVTAVQIALDVCFPDEVWVRGEISSLRRARSGHVYFQLIEPGPPGAPPVARVAVTLFASDKASVNATLRRVRGVRMTDGVEIRIRGRLGVYGPQGQLQLKMSAIDPDYTLGRLASDRERILSGAASPTACWIATGGSPFPPRPRRIGLVTSAGSAAEADFLHELEQSGLGFEVVVIDSPVQGNDADRALTGALSAAVDARRRGRRHRARRRCPHRSRRLRQRATGPRDRVARAPGADRHRPRDRHQRRRPGGPHRLQDARPPAPRSSSPTADAFHHQVDQLWRDGRRPGRVGARRVEQPRAPVGDLRDPAGHRLARRRPRSRSTTGRNGWSGAHRARSSPARLRLDSLDSRVAALDPARALARGWSITRTESGELVRDPAQVHRRRPPASPRSPRAS